MFDKCKDKWIIEGKHIRILKLELFTVTLLQDYNTMTKEPNGIYIVQINIVGFNDSIKGYITKSKSWEDAQEEAEAILYILLMSLEKELR